MTTVGKAIVKARRIVRMVNQGDQYVIHTWSPRHNATWISHPMDYWRAREALRENRIPVALEALGNDPSDGEAYHLAQQIGRWDELVRDYVGTKKP